MNALVIWDETSEEISFIEINNLSQEDINLLAQLHQKYINGYAEPSWMNNYFYNVKNEFKFVKLKKCIFNKKYDLIIFCGFIC